MHLRVTCLDLKIRTCCRHRKKWRTGVGGAHVAWLSGSTFGETVGGEYWVFPLSPSTFVPYCPYLYPLSSQPPLPLSSSPFSSWLWDKAISLSDSLQMDVVYTFQTGASSLQGALRRQPSIVSQHHDVKNVSSPTHVALSSVNSTPTTSAAAAAASPPAGSEW